MKRVRGRISNFAEYSISSLSSCQRDGLGGRKRKGVSRLFVCVTRGAWSSARVAKPSISCREGGRRPDEQATRVGPSHQCELTHLVFKTTNGIVAVGGPPFAGHVARLSAWPAQGVTFAKWCEDSCSPRLQLRRLWPHVNSSLTCSPGLRPLPSPQPSCGVPHTGNFYNFYPMDRGPISDSRKGIQCGLRQILCRDVTGAGWSSDPDMMAM